MSDELLIALAAFAFVTSVTPGPNTLMLMASGANFGFRRTLPHLLSVALGFAAMIGLVGIGLAGAFDAWPALQTVLKIVSGLYLGWLAWRIATAAPPERPDGAAVGRPLTFIQAALFQWVNPKAWAMALSAIAVYAPSRSGLAVALVAVVFGAIGLPTGSLWAVLGQEMRRVLTNPARLRVFNVTMAALLIASLLPVVFAEGLGG